MDSFPEACIWKEERTHSGWQIIWVVSLVLLTTPAFTQVMTKAQVSDLIKKVEDGVDEFKDYTERKGESAQERASSPKAQSRRGRRGGDSSADTESRKALASENKDELEEALEDLEKATDRLRRRFRRSDKYMETKVQVEKVVDEGREINEVVVRGRYGSEVARIWAALRTRINELARVYGVKPLAI